MARLRYSPRTEVCRKPTCGTFVDHSHLVHIHTKEGSMDVFVLCTCHRGRDDSNCKAMDECHSDLGASNPQRVVHLAEFR
jgi:hypothetical protein